MFVFYWDSALGCDGDHNARCIVRTTIRKHGIEDSIAATVFAGMMLFSRGLGVDRLLKKAAARGALSTYGLVLDSRLDLTWVLLQGVPRD